jgi:hypothetical protein
MGAFKIFGRLEDYVEFGTTIYTAREFRSISSERGEDRSVGKYFSMRNMQKIGILVPNETGKVYGEKEGIDILESIL